jgi:putative nucleotidyltransferase with HDIG domain
MVFEYLKLRARRRGFGLWDESFGECRERRNRKFGDQDCIYRKEYENDMTGTNTITALPLQDQPMLNLTTLIDKVTDLPPLPAIVLRALEMTMDPEVSVRDLQSVISQDQALSATILRVVNSAMYALRREVSTVSHAVTVLGIETVKSIIMAASVEGVFDMAKDLGTKLMSDHSWGTALASRLIARRIRYSVPEEALVCGLMHDIGKPVLLNNFQSRYQEIISEAYKGNSSFHQLELQSFGFSHAHVGALLANKWNFPPQLSEAVGFHHNPLSAPKHGQLACIVNLANIFMISLGIGFEKDKSVVLEEQPAAEHLNLTGSDLQELAVEIQKAVETAETFAS